MRLLFLVLVLANLGLFAWTQFTRESALRTQLQRLEVSPAKVRITGVGGGVEPHRASPEPAVAQTPVPAPAACIEWGPFAGPEVARANEALALFELAPERITRLVAEAGGYWVLMPPLKSKAEVDRKVQELKELGVADFFVVPDAGQWRNAISLGIFKTEEAAESYLSQIKARGVRSAVLERRDNFLKIVTFVVREPDQALVGRLAQLQQAFPGTELRAARCPEPATVR